MKKLGDIFTGPEKWAKGCNARDSEGKKCRISRACSLCLFAATSRLGLDGGERTQLVDQLDAAARKRGYNGLVRFNDAPETTFQDVLNLLAECGQYDAPAPN